MKRAGVVLITLIILYSTYYDLTFGTLPSHFAEAGTESKAMTESNVKQAPQEQAQDEAYQEVIVEPGYTVLSIVEHLHDESVPASIEEVIHDFKQLNPNIEPESIQIGHSYLFPVYN